MIGCAKLLIGLLVGFVAGVSLFLLGLVTVVPWLMDALR